MNKMFCIENGTIEEVTQHPQHAEHWEHNLSNTAMTAIQRGGERVIVHSASLYATHEEASRMLDEVIASDSEEF